MVLKFHHFFGDDFMRRFKCAFSKLIIVFEFHNALLNLK